MKRYNQVRNGTYEPRSEMVEETYGDYVEYEDAAELLDACESALTAMKNNDWNEHDSVFIGLRAAIAKAKGVQP